MSDDLINGGRIINGNIVWDNKMSAYTDEEIAPGIEATNGEEVEVLIQTFGMQSDLRGRASYHLQRLKSERDSLAKENEKLKTQLENACGNIDTLVDIDEKGDAIIQTLERERDDLLKLLATCESQVVMRIIELQEKTDSFMGRENFVLADIYRAKIRSAKDILTAIDQATKQPTQDEKQEGE